MKAFILTSIVLFPLITYAQFHRGWQVHMKDSIWVVKHEEKQNIIRSTGIYPNEQEKYTIGTVYSQILDTVSYYSKDNKLISRVLYKPVEYTLLNNDYASNYEYIDSARAVIQNQIKLNFPSGIIHNYMFFDASNSIQLTPRNHGFSNQSHLYEPLETQVVSCRMDYSIFINSSRQKVKNLIYFEVDSNYQIVKSNIDLNRIYNVKYDLEFANSVGDKYDYRNVISSDKMRGIKINGPYLEIRNKDIYWVLQRQSGILLSSNDLESLRADTQLEEITINSETGEIQKYLLTVGTDD